MMKLIVQHFSTLEALSPEANVLLSLLPHPNPPSEPHIPSSLAVAKNPLDGSQNLGQVLSARSSNNHWMVYDSELSATGEGVYPSASRSFNHSCLPSAIPVFCYAEGKGPVMEVRALTQIKKGEEV